MGQSVSCPKDQRHKDTTAPRDNGTEQFMSRPLIIAIDGPSGSGKSTLGRMLARELNLLYIDTGSMYRAVALAVMESSVSSYDDVAVGSLASRVSIDLRGDPDSMEVTLEGARCHRRHPERRSHAFVIDHLRDTRSTPRDG